MANTKQKDWCSNFPDEVDGIYYGDCCHNHDIVYAKPGDRHDRARADRALRDCIKAKTGKNFLANLMYFGVRSFGWTPWHFNRTIFFKRVKEDEERIVR